MSRPRRECPNRQTTPHPIEADRGRLSQWVSTLRARLAGEGQRVSRAGVALWRIPTFTLVAELQRRGFVVLPGDIDED